MAVKLSQDRRQAMIDEWRGQVAALLDQVAGWAHSQGWRVERTDTTVREDRLPEYPAQTLEIQISEENQVYLEPIARFTFSGRGVVELKGWPSLRRVRLEPTDSGAGATSWIVMTDSGIPLRQDWNGRNFATLVQDLVAE